MNRTDRLYAITEELRRAGPAGRTAARLAERFEVSVRTVKRDLTALQDAGVPIGATAGPGGGYVLDSAATLPPSPSRTPRQRRSLWRSPPYHLPFATDGAAAMSKILDAMGVTAREGFEDLARRVWVNAGDVPRSPVTRIIEEALRNRVVIDIDYTDAGGILTVGRPVEPHLFGYTGGHWYLFAWCLRKQAPRWFRWDRISRAVPTRVPVQDRDTVATFGMPPPGARPAVRR